MVWYALVDLIAGKLWRQYIWKTKFYGMLLPTRTQTPADETAWLAVAVSMAAKIWQLLRYDMVW